jgi:ABC-type Na+ transport system ATPase subunit NatA
MIKKTVRCPSCSNVFTFFGEPGQVLKVKCPKCLAEGKITFERTTAPEDNAIQVSCLRKVYGDIVAVDNISFSVRKGEIFAFLGPNGAGKTTTVEIIECIREPTAGTVKIFDKDISTSFNDVKERIGILPQEFHSFERLTVRETLVYFSKLYKKRADVDEIIKAILSLIKTCCTRNCLVV